MLAFAALALNTAAADSSQITSLTWISLGAATTRSDVGPVGGLGFRASIDKTTALEASASLFTTEDGIGGSLIRFSGYRYSKRRGPAMYAGGGLGLGGYSELGFGVQAHGSVGYEFLRREAIGGFTQADLTLPLLSVDGGYDQWSPMLTLRVGFGFGGTGVAWR